MSEITRYPGKDPTITSPTRYAGMIQPVSVYADFLRQCGAPDDLGDVRLEFLDDSRVIRLPEGTLHVPVTYDETVRTVRIHMQTLTEIAQAAPGGRGSIEASVLLAAGLSQAADYLRFGEELVNAEPLIGERRYRAGRYAARLALPVGGVCAVVGGLETVVYAIAGVFSPPALAAIPIVLAATLPSATQQVRADVNIWRGQQPMEARPVIARAIQRAASYRSDLDKHKAELLIW